MHLIKKSIVLSTVFSVTFVGLLAGACVSEQEKVTNASPTTATLTPVQLLATVLERHKMQSGSSNLAKTMADEQSHRIALADQKDQYAQVNDLGDIDIPGIAQAIGCTTHMGTLFLQHALNRPRGPQGKAALIGHRHNIQMLVESPVLKQQVDEILKQSKEHAIVATRMFSNFYQDVAAVHASTFNLPKLSPALDVFFDVTSLYALPVSVHSIHSSLQYMSLHDPFGILIHTYDIGLHALNMLGTTTYTISKYRSASKMRLRLHSVNKLIEAAQTLDTLLTQHGIQREYPMSTLKKVPAVNLIKSLNSARYKYKDTKIFQPSLVAHLHKVFYQNMSEFTPLWLALGELDVLNACATKILASKNTKNKFCFATFVEQDKPLIKTQGCWNVVARPANPDASVSNDLDENRSIILTGPNAGGKTTITKAVVQNILLAQAFGIAAADSWQMTIFDSVHVYLKSHDDLSKGLSLFASELKRTQDIKQHINGLKPGQKFFFALDEMFTSTDNASGEQCAYRFVKQLTKSEHIQFIYATHFNSLKQLAAYNDRCTNYKIDLPTKKDAAGNFIYPFTMSKGANQKSVALEMADAAGLIE